MIRFFVEIFGLALKTHSIDEVVLSLNVDFVNVFFRFLNS